VRLDHLLSKEHHYRPGSVCMDGSGVCGSKPIAQAFVLRWVLMGGISTNQFFGMAFRSCPGASTAPVPLWCGCWERAGVWWRGVVFGALLGPEATGPGFVVFGCGFWYLGVSGFLSVPVMCWLSLLGVVGVWGVRVGVVV
jgi:hypothetical protein